MQCPMPGLVFPMERVNFIVTQTQMEAVSTCIWVRSGGANSLFDLVKTDQDLSWYEIFSPVSPPDLKLPHFLGLFLYHAHDSFLVLAFLFLAVAELVISFIRKK